MPDRGWNPYYRLKHYLTPPQIAIHCKLSARAGLLSRELIGISWGVYQRVIPAVRDSGLALNLRRRASFLTAGGIHRGKRSISKRTNRVCSKLA